MSVSACTSLCPCVCLSVHACRKESLPSAGMELSVRQQRRSWVFSPQDLVLIGCNRQCGGCGEGRGKRCEWFWGTDSLVPRSTSTVPLSVEGCTLSCPHKTASRKNTPYIISKSIHMSIELTLKRGHLPILKYPFCCNIQCISSHTYIYMWVQ